MPQHRVGCRVCGARRSSRFREWSSYAEHAGFQEVEFMIPKSGVICSRCHQGSRRGNLKRPAPEEHAHESGDELTSQESASLEGEVAARMAQRKQKLTDRAKSGCYSCGTTRSSRFRRWQDSVLAPKLAEIRVARPESEVICAACWAHFRTSMDIRENVHAEIPDQEMLDAEAEDDETHSKLAQPLPATPPVDAGKRFRVTTSNIGGKLSPPPDEAAKVYREVAERIVNDGYLSLTEAAEILGKKHTGRALEKLMAILPFVAFASSRKEGWLLIPKDEEQYASIHTLIRRAAEQGEITANFGNLSPGEFFDLACVCSPAEKLLMRYMLAKIYGIEEAAKRFSLSSSMLKTDLQRVADALTEVDAVDIAAHDEYTQTVSGYKRQQAFHTALQQKQDGGRQAWEKNEAAKTLTVALAQEAGVKIHPSLNDKVEHVVGATLSDLKDQLDQAHQEGKISHSPSKAALSRAMTRRGGRQGLPIRMGVTKKVVGSAHPNLEVINKMMANMRHFHVRPERVGHVAVIAVDDLEKMPLDQLAYNGRKVQTVAQPTLAPTSNYANGRKLVFTSILVLSMNTIANHERAEKKRPKLVRYVKDASSLPLAAAQDFVAGGWHKTTKLHQHLFSATDRGRPVPWLILTSDGASDQSVQNLMTIIPLVELLQMLDLDGLEKWNYCPGHSKYNPAERLNSTVKGVFRGGVIRSGNGQKQAMEEVKRKAAAHLKRTTHGGESIRTIAHHRAGVGAGRNGDQDRQRWELSIEYDDLKKFSEYRSKVGPWRTTPVREEVLAGWRESEDLDELMFAEMEDRLQWVIDHTRHYNIYGVVLTKCAEDDPDKCAWCKEHPWCSKNWYEERTTAENAVCPNGAQCPAHVCDHDLNKTYLRLLLAMDAITPESGRTPRLCSICRTEGHNKKTCPQRQRDGAAE